MHITKKTTGYVTEDQQTFPTFGEAVGHAKRLAIAHYLQVIRHQLHEETGLLKLNEKLKLRGIADAIEEIMEERPALTYADGSRQQSPLQLAA